MILTHFILFMAGEAAPAVVLPLWLRPAGAEPGAFELKSPASVIERGFDWTLAEGETIISSTWSISQLVPDDGLAVVAGSARIEGTVTAVKLEGGVFRRTATVTNTIMTSAGQVLTDSFSMRFGPVGAG